MRFNKLLKVSFILENGTIISMSDQMPKDFIEEVKRHYERIIVLPYQPTTELMLLDFSKKIKKRLPENVSLVKIFLKETEGSYAELIEE